MKLVVINQLSPEKEKELASTVPGLSVEWYKTPKEAISHVQDADVIAMWGFQEAEPLLAAAPKVKWIHSLSDGVERLLSPSMMTRPIVLTNSRGIHDVAVAEHTFALLLALTRALPTAIRQQEKGIWKRSKAFLLSGKTVVIVGFGSIGRAIAKRLSPFGCHIIGVKRTVTPEPLADEVVPTAEIETVLPHADVVIAALPATPDTSHFFDTHLFSLMKESAYFINIARASIVDKKALAKALQQGPLAGAGIDVFSKEPLPPNHPFWMLENVIMTPHVASWTPDTWSRLLQLLQENLRAFYEGRPLQNEVNKEKGY